MSYVDFIIEMIHPKLPKSGRIIAASSDAINAMCHYMTYSIEELNRQKRWNNNNLIWFFTSESEVLITESGEAVCQVVEKFKENMRSLDDEIFNIWVGKCIHSF
ncbi:hypothetical protein CkP1_0032 [Citrobacter phage CkP1]|nr:hypothetical protein CkP1_0032 [Citrobacter phage CkP1]